MPKWVSAKSLDYVIAFFKTGRLQHINKDEIFVQKLLWLSDFLDLEQFQSIFIKEKTIPIINHLNSLRFLAESAKKLKSKTKYNDIWHSLFSCTMGVTSKNLVWNRINRKDELMNLNPEVLEEIIEKAYDNQNSSFQTDEDQIIDLLKEIREKDDIFELLVSQRQICQQKEFSNFNFHTTK